MAPKRVAFEQPEVRLTRGEVSRNRLRSSAAAELVERRGHLEVESVASRAGVSVGLIYRHFGSRAGLVEAVMADFYGRYRADVLGTNPYPRGTWAERERRRTALGVAFHYQEPLARVVLSHLHLDAQVAVYEARQLDEMVEMCASVVALGQQRRELPRDRDTRLTAAMIIGGMRRVLATALATEPLPSERKVVHDLWRFIAGSVGIDPDQS